MPILENNGIKTYFETHGSGEPLVLIPGFASGAWIWFKQIEPLARHFRVITFDPRGISKSEVEPNTSVSIADIAEDVAGLLDHLDIAAANILGASFGGFVAQEFALKYPKRVAKLALACTSFGGKNHVPPAPEVLAAFASVDGLNSLPGVKKYLLPAFTPEFVAANTLEVDHICSLREQNIVPETVYFGQLQSATTFDTEARIGAITTETLILSGDKDTVVPLQNSKNLAAAIPCSTLKVVSNGSHMFFIEQADTFNHLVTEFLTT